MHFANFTDMKGISQEFWRFKTFDMLEVSAVLKGQSHI
jgi:hypothetical protein